MQEAEQIEESVAYTGSKNSMEKSKDTSRFPSPKVTSHPINKD
jgi:hypothetical protein